MILSSIPGSSVIEAFVSDSILFTIFLTLISGAEAPAEMPIFFLRR